jgi:hypothetical protein
VRSTHLRTPNPHSPTLLLPLSANHSLLESVAAAANAGLVTTIVDFFFWRWPFVSAFAFVLWQFLVSMPSMLPAVFPLVGVTALVRTYLAVPSQSLQPMRNRLSVSQLFAALLFDSKHGPLARDPLARDPLTQVTMDEGAHSDDDYDEDEDEDREKRAASAAKVSKPPPAKPSGKATARVPDPPPPSPPPKRMVARAASEAKFFGILRQDDPASCESVLPTLLPEAGSLQEQMDSIMKEVDEEARGEYMPDQGYTLNPLAAILGPIQAVLYSVVSHHCRPSLKHGSSRERPTRASHSQASITHPHEFESLGRHAATRSWSRCASSGVSCRGRTASSRFSCW